MVNGSFKPYVVDFIFNFSSNFNHLILLALSFLDSLTFTCLPICLVFESMVITPFRENTMICIMMANMLMSKIFESFAKE